MWGSGSREFPVDKVNGVSRDTVSAIDVPLGTDRHVTISLRQWSTKTTESYSTRDKQIVPSREVKVRTRLRHDIVIHIIVLALDRIIVKPHKNRRPVTIRLGLAEREHTHVLHIQFPRNGDFVLVHRHCKVRVTRFRRHMH